MRGLQAPNAGDWAAVKLYDYSQGHDKTKRRKPGGTAKLGVNRQRKQEPCCMSLQNGVENSKLERSGCKDCMISSEQASTQHYHSTGMCGLQ